MSRMLDTNVLLDIPTADVKWLVWSTAQFRAAVSAGPILIKSDSLRGAGGGI